MKILLGVCGGVAAYKAAELTREFRRRGATVQILMTENAERFVTPLTFAALSGNQVMTSLWQPVNREVSSEEPGSFDIEHIHVAHDADVLVIAPATANFIATMAHGFAGDLLSAVALATTLPIVIAPAMNTNMWAHPATQANLETLRQRGVQIVAPGSGELACGMVGDGRLAEPIDIANHVLHLVHRRQGLAGETILITAGGTREPIDAVRFIGNRSSGKMGFALAEAACARGAQVILISASTTLPVPACCEHVRVTTGAQMQHAVLAALPRASMVIMAAAVSDYQVQSPSAQKIKKTETLTLELTRTPDILKQIVQQRSPGTVVVGFAAETEHVVKEGRRKLREKGAHLIVANDVSQADSGFDADQNAGILISETEEQTVPLCTKRQMAERILDGATSIARQMREGSEVPQAESLQPSR